MIRNLAASDSSVHVASFRINAFDVAVETARRIACAGSLARTFFTFMSQLEGAFLLLLIETPHR